MTDKEALAEARRRWGPFGWAEMTRPGNWEHSLGKTHAVGRKSLTLGAWTSFEDAFADADRRAGRP